MIFCIVLPLPLTVRPLPELPDVCEKSIVALFLPVILTPDGNETAPDLTVPSITIVVPEDAFLIASASDVPPFFTTISLSDEVLPDELLPDELLPDELLPDELLPLLSTCIL